VLPVYPKAGEIVGSRPGAGCMGPEGGLLHLVPLVRRVQRGLASPPFDPVRSCLMDARWRSSRSHSTLLGAPRPGVRG
jgi:hypothetical protein